ncbi:MAG TPA: maleylacetate reductase [Candidatus Sulfotelmatobacter sp.]|nr:maleylacetate reductase [Candidatus Sulfotelmatobacter sp.]
MRGFVYEGTPTRVVFAAGASAQLAEELDRAGLRAVLLVAGDEQYARLGDVAAALGARVGGTFNEVREHVPVALAARARRFAAEIGADGIVALGGGSAIGLAKAVALTSGLPIVAVPTTYAGSEMTPIYGLTEDGRKTTGRDPRVRPQVVVYDPLLTRTLSPELSAASGLNALAHAVEALYAIDANPVVSLIAEESIRALAAGLPRVVEGPDDVDARAQCLYGAWLAGIALGSVSMALHHKLCHTLGGTWDLPHARTHAVVLPHAAAYNAPAAPTAMARVARALGVDDAPRGLADLARRLGVPGTLRELGFPSAALDRAADLAAASPYPNPRPIERDAIRALLARAFDGELARA